jgi:hypothetical protein
MSRFKGKPVGGLPERLPADETLLWQGAPEWKALARYAFRVRIVGGYFALLVVWRVAATLLGGHGLMFSLGTGVNGTFMGAVAVAMFCAFSWLIARSTTYSITNKRVVITYGMALPKSVNLPYSRIEAADLRVNEDGSGDIALRLPQKVRLSYLLLWPHVRAGKSGRAEPVLRGIADPQATAAILTTAIGQTLAPAERAEIAEPALAASGTMRAQAA